MIRITQHSIMLTLGEMAALLSLALTMFLWGVFAWVYVPQPHIALAAQWHPASSYYDYQQFMEHEK